MIFGILSIMRALCAYNYIGENTVNELLALLALLPAGKDPADDYRSEPKQLHRTHA